MCYRVRPHQGAEDERGIPDREQKPLHDKQQLIYICGSLAVRAQRGRREAAAPLTRRYSPPPKTLGSFQKQEVTGLLRGRQEKALK